MALGQGVGGLCLVLCHMLEVSGQITALGEVDLTKVGATTSSSSSTMTAVQNLGSETAVVVGDL